MRRVRLRAAGLTAAALLVIHFPAAVARDAPAEQLVMPFACAIDGGRIVLTPALETGYALVGPRQQQPFTSCPIGASERCRTLMVHKLSLICGTEQVSWARVVAAMKGAKVGRTWLEKGRLVIERTAEPSAGDAVPCTERDATSSPPASGAGRSGDCLPWKPASTMERMVLPEGYAPVGEVGARLLFEPLKPGVTAQQVDAQLLPAAATATAASRPPAVITATISDAREPSPVSTAATGPIDQADATAATAPQGPQARSASPTAKPEGATRWITARFLALLGLAGLALLAPLVLVWRRFKPGALAGALGPLLTALPARIALLRLGLVSAGGDPDRDRLSNGLEQVLALLTRTERAVAELKSAGALQEVLSQELSHMRQRLSSARTAALEGDRGRERAAQLIRALVREIERIDRIAASARASLSHARESRPLPTTRSEAYEVLGVNSDVSDTVLKKIVDALRMSWHPDLARDEGDRQEREERIKRINLAWELISSERRRAA